MLLFSLYTMLRGSTHSFGSASKRCISSSTFHSLFFFFVCLWFALDNIRMNTREMLFLLSKSIVSYCVMCRWLYLRFERLRRDKTSPLTRGNYDQQVKASPKQLAPSFTMTFLTLTPFGWHLTNKVRASMYIYSKAITIMEHNDHQLCLFLSASFFSTSFSIESQLCVPSPNSKRSSTVQP